MRRLLLLAVISLGALVAAPAAAQAAPVPNSCYYNYDAYYRDTPVDVTGAATIAPAPPRYPAPTGSAVDPGQTIVLAGAPISVALPANLPEFGYRSGLLHPDENIITAKVWVAIKATNTAEGVQVQGPFTVTATTTIEVEPSDGHFLSDNGFTYTNPTLADTTWTAVGGDVAFSQAGPGTLGTLPVGAGGTNRAVAGSVVIQANLGAANDISFYMDCQPGATQGINPTDGAGPTFVATTAPPFDATISGPRNVTCLNALGRLASGGAAGLPAGVTREIDPIGVTLSATGGASPVTLGAAPYTLGGAKAHVTIPAASVATLANYEDPPGSPLITADEVYPLDLWVSIKGTNTVEGTQTVQVSGTYALHPVSGSPGSWQAYDATIDLPATTWTPAGAGTMAFSIAPPGSMPAITVTGAAATDPLGATAATSYSVTPYGSAVLRAGTERNAVTLDCVPGAAAVSNDAIAFSNLGRLAPPNGSGGRYGLLANPSPPVIATASAVAPTAPPPPVDDTPVEPSAPPPAPPPGPPPVVAPPLTPPAGPGKIASAKLSTRGGKIALQLTCAGSSTSCAGTISLRSAIKLRLGGRLKVVTIARNATYTIAAGKRKAVTLTLSSEARALLARRRSLRVTIALKPRRGASVTRTVTLSR